MVQSAADDAASQHMVQPISWRQQRPAADEPAADEPAAKGADAHDGGGGSLVTRTMGADAHDRWGG